MTFLERTTDPRKHRVWEGHMEADYIYTSGVAGERFFVALRDEGRLLASRCTSCHLDYLPARLFCEDCFAELTEFVDVPGEGRVKAVTVAHVKPGASVSAVVLPYKPAKKLTMARATLKIGRQRQAVAAAR